MTTFVVRRSRELFQLSLSPCEVFPSDDTLSFGQGGHKGRSVEGREAIRKGGRGGRKGGGMGEGSKRGRDMGGEGGGARGYMSLARPPPQPGILRSREGAGGRGPDTGSARDREDAEGKHHSGKICM